MRQRIPPINSICRCSVRQYNLLIIKDITEDILALTGDLIVKTYDSAGIIPGPDGRYPSFKGIRKEDMPTFREFNQVLRTEIDEKRNEGCMI